MQLFTLITNAGIEFDIDFRFLRLTSGDFARQRKTFDGFDFCVAANRPHSLWRAIVQGDFLFFRSPAPQR